MEIKDVPLLKKKVLTTKVTVAVDEETRQLWDELKTTRGIDLPEMMRRHLAELLPKLKSKAS